MLRKFILNDREVEKTAFIWNTIATISSSFQTMLLMLVLSHNGDFTSASIITIGYAIANLAMTIGKYGIRNFQVSDVQEKYGFRTYLHARYITVAMLVLFSLMYIAKGILFDGYSIEKAWCVLLICIYKGIESYEDVYHGRMQQMNRLDIGMRILAVRNIIYILEFIIIYCITQNLLFSLAISVFTTLLLMFTLNSIPEKNVYFSSKESAGNTKELLVECLPVAVAAFLLMYLGNAPKYIMDAMVSDEEQTYFNIIFMVTFAVNLMSVFVFNPLLRKMSVLWNGKMSIKLQNYVTRILFYITGMVIVGIVFANFVGRNLLGWIYGVSLDQYNTELILLLVAGGLLSVLNLMNVIFVMIRQQNVLLILCVAASFMLLLFGKMVLQSAGILGLCLLYMLVLGVLDIALLTIFKQQLLKI